MATFPGVGMNAEQVRVGVDLVLTQHARGYSNQQYAGGKLFPTVIMPTRSAKRMEFGTAALEVADSGRAPGANVNEVTLSYEGKPVNLQQEALDAVTPTEHQQEAMAVPGVDLQKENVNTTLAKIALIKELRQARLARDASQYANSNKTTLAGTDLWSDPASDPSKLVADIREDVRRGSGYRPNVGLLGAVVASALKNHPKVRDHFKYTQSAAISDAMLAEYLDIGEIVVGDAVFVNTGTREKNDVWGNDAIFAYVPKGAELAMAVPAYGYTYQLAGHPFVDQVAWIRSRRSWGNHVVDEFSPEIVGPDAGFLVKNAV